MSNPFSPAVLDNVRHLDGSRRFLLLGGLLLAGAVIWGLSTWAGSPRWVTLYSGLEYKSAGEITAALDKAGIRNRPENGGSEVQVDMDDLAKARVLLAMNNLPASGTGYRELLDNPSAGLQPDPIIRMNIQRALEGELARTIGSLRGIEQAQVHLTLPESSPLRKLERPAEAAVVLTLRQGYTLPADAVQGIVNIVSHSVDRLPAENVAVLDGAGHILAQPNDNGSTAGLSSRQLDLQHSIEQAAQSKAVEMLSTVVGSGRARVQVSAKLDFDQTERTIESYNPDGAVLSNEQRQETTGDTGDSLAGNSTTVNNSYLNSRTVEKILSAGGGVNRLTASVLVDEKALTKQSGGAAREVQIANLELMVKNAIGFDSARGDRVTVLAMPFEAEPATAVSVTDSSPGPGTPIVVYVERFSRPAIGLVGIVAIFLLAMRVLRPAPGGAGRSGAVGVEAMAPPPAQDPELPPVHVTEIAALASKLKNQVSHESSQRPDTAAQVVKTWLSDT
jgi:flagellar M-ring protein FliF